MTPEDIAAFEQRIDGIDKRVVRLETISWLRGWAAKLLFGLGFTVLGGILVRLAGWYFGF